MLAQLEPLLMEYGIWAALLLVVVVFILLGVLFVWMRKNNAVAEDLNIYFERLSESKQILTGWETSLNAYQQQINSFAGESAHEAQKISPQLENVYGQVIRLKSRLRELESRLPQEGEALAGAIDTLEGELSELSPAFEEVHQWFKQLQQNIAGSKTQLHQLQAEMEAMPEVSQALANRLFELQQADLQVDPLAHFKAIAQLQYDLQQPVVVSPAQTVASAEEAQRPELAPQPEPLIEEIAVAEAIPVSQPDSAEAGPALSSEQALPTLPEDATDSIMVIEPETSSEEAIEAEDTLEMVLENTPVEPQESVAEQSVDTVSPAETPELAAAGELSAESNLAPEVSFDVSEAAAVAEPAETTESSAEPEQADEPESNPLSRFDFVTTSQQLQDAPAQLKLIEQALAALSQRFQLKSWQEFDLVAEQSAYRVKEMAAMAQLAERLAVHPRVPEHRVVLNLQRIAAKYQQLFEVQQQLQTKAAELENSQTHLQTELQRLTDILRQHQASLPADWLQQQAAALLRLRQLLEQVPVALLEGQALLADTHAEIQSQGLD